MYVDPRWIIGMQRHQEEQDDLRDFGHLSGGSRTEVEQKATHPQRLRVVHLGRLAQKRGRHIIIPLVRTD
jgi:hypothetical protein